MSEAHESSVDLVLAYIEATQRARATQDPKDFELLRKYLAEVRFHAYTAQTITSRAKLEREIEAVRKQGYALDLEEFAENLCCVSVPVRDPADGAIAAAVSIAMPKLRFKRNQVPRWRRLLDEKAALISPQLGLIDA